MPSIALPDGRVISFPDGPEDATLEDLCSSIADKFGFPQQALVLTTTGGLVLSPTMKIGDLLKEKLDTLDLQYIDSLELPSELLSVYRRGAEAPAQVCATSLPLDSRGEIPMGQCDVSCQKLCTPAGSARASPGPSDGSQMTTLSPSPGFAGGLPLIWNPGLYSQEHSCPSEGLFLRTSEALPLRGEPTSNGNGNNSDLSDSDSDSTDTSIGELVGSTGRRRRGLSELATRDTSTQRNGKELNRRICDQREHAIALGVDSDLMAMGSSHLAVGGADDGKGLREMTAINSMGHIKELAKISYSSLYHQGASFILEWTTSPS